MIRCVLHMEIYPERTAAGFFRQLALWLCLLGCGVFWPMHTLYAQAFVGEMGNPIAELHTAREYNAHGQNFAMVQDKRGLMYFGNFAGILEYDGMTWRTITTKNYAKVSALYLDPSGRIFVGANGEFGYLQPDAKGTLFFKSISDSLKTAFGEILTIVGKPEGIYFVSKKNVYLWKNNRVVKEWYTDDPILSAFEVSGQMFFYQKNKGITRFNGKSITKIPVNPRLNAFLDVTSMLPLDAQSTLIVTSNQGLFQVKNNYIDQFKTPANAYLITNQISAGARLSSNLVALATLQGGIVLMDSLGIIRQIIRGDMFEEAQVNSLFEAQGGILWMALNNGLAQVDIPSPMSVFDDAANVKGAVNHLLRYQGEMYLGTLNGLFVVNGFRAQQISGLNASCFYLAEASGGLLAATSKGVYRISGGRAQPLTNDFAVYLYPLRSRPGFVLVGLENGLAILDLSRKSYKLVPGLDDQIVGVAEDTNGNVWLETLSKGLYRTDPQFRSLSLYGIDKGLKTLLYNQVYQSSQGLLAWNKNGIFRYNVEKDSFESFNLFKTDSTAAAYWKGELVEDRSGNFWTTRGDEKFVTLYKKQSAGQYEEIVKPFRAFSDRTFKVIYPDADSIVWFGGPEGAIRFDLRQSDDFLKTFPAIIRKINNKTDTLFNGFFQPGTTVKNTVVNPTGTRISYAENDISFVFSAPSYNVGEELMFRFYLENYDETWSDWTTQNQKEYTNLSPGRYVFRVKSRNIYNSESEEAVFQFVIERPWYRMWWAFVLYFLVFVAVLSYLIRWRLRALVKEKDQLENMITERTEEISSQKEELEKQSVELASKNDQLEKIDLIVQSINSEIEFTSLFETVLAKLNIIRNMENATALIYDKESNSFKFKAAFGEIELSQLDGLALTLQEAEERYLTNAAEMAEDVYFKTEVPFPELGNALDGLAVPKSLITIVINVEGNVEGFITLENASRTHAFDQRDFDMIRNLKEHLIAAFIKTRILENLEKTLNNLKVAQEELIRQERLASVGQLTRGIVDRILNPLNYINNFSESSYDLIDELTELIEEHNVQFPEEIADDYFGDLDMLKVNLLKIKEHGNSTTRIVKDMQRLLKEKSVDFIETDLNSFVENKVQVATQELKKEQKDKELDLNVTFEFDAQSPKVKLLPYEMSSVIANIVNNAFYSMQEKKKIQKNLESQLVISTQIVGKKVWLRFKDNGKGIPKKEMEQLFSPFFTTKPTSKGTGLGLYMSKDIVETHKGEIDIESKEGEYVLLTIRLPIA
ncbi:sensor histidine kinase [Arundinibacter roseus]|nr:ATP-binding protein [Arundinibacter roseus]